MAKRAKTKVKSTSRKPAASTKRTGRTTPSTSRVGASAKSGSGKSVARKSTAKKAAGKKATRSARSTKLAGSKKAGARGNAGRGTATANKARGPAKRSVGRPVGESAKRDGSRLGPPAQSQDPIQFPEEKPHPKTHLTRKQLQEYRAVLLQKRGEIEGDVSHLSREVGKRNSQASADHSTMPLHMADLGSDNWEQEFTLGLIANEQVRIREVDEALSRIEKRTYGVCVATGRKISQARLRAKPWAKYCIAYARAREEGRVR